MQDVITIVSGLPRSGTSMMMKMLEAGGMPVLVDHVREADEDNPKGYYEFEQVKKIKEDDSWLNAAAGKVVKMVSMLLYNLPSIRKYKVIFMRRNMTEILTSQRAMLERIGQGKDFNDREMGALFTKHLGEIEQWLAAQKNFEVLYVPYNDVIAKPQYYAHHINLFMHSSLSEEAMTRTVDRSLYRKRSEQDLHGAVPAAPASDDAGDQGKIEDQLKSLGYM
jgi:hypothetical protein